ncbi:MAG: hypothetical protein K1X53_02040 [Candidatus Sumerlaeaceae bacterium]|nr:hypothetical protein [Candidatus Sumerlaeaceae bacterium]
MSLSPAKLLANRNNFWAVARDGRLGWDDLLALAAFIVPGCAIYGAVLAGWRSPVLSLYVAIKLPLLFLATTAIVSVFNWMLASLLRAGLSFKATLLVVFASMSITSWILLALAPVSFFFMISGAPAAGTDSELRYAHNFMLTTHILILAVAGVAGYAAMLGGLRTMVNPGCPVGLLFVAWLGTSAFVGCQMAWILRPFVGSPFYDVAFMRPDCLDRNFYEFVFGDVIPNLLRGGL